MSDLGYEGRFEIGQIIRAYDFPPKSIFDPAFIEGPILEIRRDGEVDCQFPHYLVIVKREVFAGEQLEGIASRIDGEFCVPFQIDRDWEGRIALAQETS